MQPDKQILTLTAMVCTLAIAGAWAAEKAAGVKWRAKVTMQMNAIAVPETTVDLCLPAEDPDQAAMQQGQQGNCKMTDIKRSGNKTVADMKCTGARSSETHWEMEKKADTMNGTMTTKSANSTINIKYVYTKVGGACEVPTAPVPGAAPQGGMSQAAMEEQIRKLREQLGR